MSVKWKSINAITLAVKNMADSVNFYQAMGLTLTYGGNDADFSTLGLGGQDNTFHINLFRFKVEGEDATKNPDFTSWGRYSFKPEMKPSDAPWGERYFHIRDPSGHELSFAKKIEGHQFWRNHTP
mmetsp:Transcript_19443/g.24768  ORF Transcript_19443/g.24768 Transcript_19443/m.24768 type:complete len:125 (+) Transcript_19443:145-519(+)